MRGFFHPARHRRPSAFDNQFRVVVILGGRGSCRIGGKAIIHNGF